MIFLNYDLLDKAIEIDKNTIFVVEEIRAFADLIKMVYQYNEMSELKFFGDNQKNLKAAEIMVVSDILGYDINSAAVLKLIYADLELQLSEKPEVKSMIDKLTATISELIGYELLEHELDLEEDEITVNELFKALGIKIETTSDTIFEKLIEIVQVYKYLSKKRLLIFCNVYAYLADEERSELREYIELSNVDVLFIEPRKVSGAMQVILDEDFFLTEKNV
ncbi:CRISPR-associated protein csn2 [Enterococcus canis]|uniref:CRISPR-associated protein csn2 n=1 Tax=Enterococcus canis TaxID=214095 RepID=A0A1L8RHN7_9ENTE|nr:CRISPR-associated protein csn2 [Enterococcus canis]